MINLQDKFKIGDIVKFVDSFSDGSTEYVKVRFKVTNKYKLVVVKELGFFKKGRGIWYDYSAGTLELAKSQLSQVKEIIKHGRNTNGT